MEEAIPQPGPGQVLIRVHYSTINPFDRLCLMRERGNEGFIMGSEGSGVIQAVGEGVDSSQWVGKKVGFIGNGWARYVVKPLASLVVFKDDFDLKNGANSYVNPFTVAGLLDYGLKHGAKAVIILAASSSLAK